MSGALLQHLCSLVKRRVRTSLTNGVEERQVLHVAVMEGESVLVGGLAPFAIAVAITVTALFAAWLTYVTVRDARKSQLRHAMQVAEAERSRALLALHGDSVLRGRLRTQLEQELRCGPLTEEELDYLLWRIATRKRQEILALDRLLREGDG